MSLTDDKSPSGSAGYQLFMLTLCVYAIGAVAVRTAVHLTPQIQGVIDYADNIVCAIFFLDFLLSLWHAPNKLTYLMTWGWLDLLSSIPSLDVARWGRLARITRLLRILRLLRATKIVAGTILRRRAENGLLALVLTMLLLLIFSSIAILQCETDPTSNIRSASDALWWAVTTITTVGYGDRFPVTSDGRLVASVVMFAGVALITTMSGFLAAWFMAPSENISKSDMATLRRDIVALREALDRMERRIR